MSNCFEKYKGIFGLKRTNKRKEQQIKGQQCDISLSSNVYFTEGTWEDDQSIDSTLVLAPLGVKKLHVKCGLRGIAFESNRGKNKIPSKYAFRLNASY